MRKTIFVVCMLVAAVAANAQIKVGPQVGLNLSNMGFNYDDSDMEPDDPKMKMGLNLGLAVNFGFSDAISLKTGLLFSQKGFKMKEEMMGEDLKVKFNLNYLEIPVNLAYHIKGIQVFAGPTIGIGIAGKMKSEFGDEEDEVDIKFSKQDLEDDEDENMYANRLDLGLNIGAGYSFGPVVASINYNFGLSNATGKVKNEPDNYEDNRDDNKMKNRTLTIGVAYMFGGK